MKGYLLVNFGGPRSIKEIEPFLTELLLDEDVIRTGMPRMLHRFLFKRTAKKRSKWVAKEYEKMGGYSPIYQDTLAVAEKLQTKLNAPVMTFHRYLIETHANSFEALSHPSLTAISVFPLFPQFTYATTGSIARLFETSLPQPILDKLQWVKSYASHPAFISLFQKQIRDFLTQHALADKETVLLFSAHGIPIDFVNEGDPYQKECEVSFQKIMAHFPNVLGKLCYQSQFGPKEWLRPYTKDLSLQAREWKKRHVVFVPLSFTSDHIETLFEVEEQYMPLITAQGLIAHRLPAFNREEKWIEGIADILKDVKPVTTSSLVRKVV